MRRLLEDRETSQLKPYACLSRSSKGRAIIEPDDDTRTCFQRDRDRIVHSKAFRRLKHKTQVFVALESDHYRSRLTHSVEVAQISRQLARMLSLNEDLCEGIALAHDLGHTPFGHAGEYVLDDLMKEYGGFEHNCQSLRVVDFLERKYPMFNGLNLSYELKEGLIKHQTPYDNPEKLGSFRSLESEIVNLADQISYNNHDLDDGLSSGILDGQDLTQSIELWSEASSHIRNLYHHLSDIEMKYLINSYLISSQIKDVVETSMLRIEEYGLHSLDQLQSISDDFISFSSEMESKSSQLRHYLRTNLYSHPTIVEKNEHGQSVISFLFHYFSNHFDHVPFDFLSLYDDCDSEPRIICDYIAGMTDVYAEQLFRSLN